MFYHIYLELGFFKKYFSNRYFFCTRFYLNNLWNEVFNKKCYSNFNLVEVVWDFNLLWELARWLLVMFRARSLGLHVLCMPGKCHASFVPAGVHSFRCPRRSSSVHFLRVPLCTLTHAACSFPWFCG